MAIWSISSHISVHFLLHLSQNYVVKYVQMNDIFLGKKFHDLMVSYFIQFMLPEGSQTDIWTPLPSPTPTLHKRKGNLEE